jgi:hypothetical protein
VASFTFDPLTRQLLRLLELRGFHPCMPPLAVFRPWQDSLPRRGPQQWLTCQHPFAVLRPMAELSAEADVDYRSLASYWTAYALLSQSQLC